MPCASWAVQGCSCCDESLEAAVTEAAENQPDLELLDAETWSSGCQQRPGEDPTNADATSCHVTSDASNTET